MIKRWISGSYSTLNVERRDILCTPRRRELDTAENSIVALSRTDLYTL
ncbi:hypothetical protein ACLIKE_06865 [Ferroplasma acidiphilum]|uniref:Uncharacterized protein n=1 Tax=Ferroplasma acidiphilum TaxID=74969 RepID=A0A7K4FR38_9ARCH|nr:hypothetical protein [Ferroplasma acidiphilum]NOL60587.1 hypothetical protein [Ferroplasma acidiphilum]